MTIRPWPARSTAMRVPIHTVLTWLLVAAPASAWAQISDPPVAPSEKTPERYDYVVGLAMVSAPTYSGAAGRELSLRPVAAVRWGRFRISSSRGGALLGFGTDTPAPGVSADLFSSDRFNLGLAVRGDNGRSVGDDPALAGLPDIRTTLRARLYAGYRLTPAWGLGLSVSQDLLGRGGGATGTVDLGYRFRSAPGTEWTVGGGANFGSLRYVQNHFGVPASAVPVSGYPLYEPGAGLVDLHVGAGVTTLISRRWIAFGGVGASRLQGDAARSPLTRQPGSVTGTVGLAWRCCG
jgi:MipA family protein